MRIGECIVKCRTESLSLVFFATNAKRLLGRRNVKCGNVTPSSKLPYPLQKRANETPAEPKTTIRMLSDKRTPKCPALVCDHEIGEDPLYVQYGYADYSGRLRQ